MIKVFLTTTLVLLIAQVSAKTVELIDAIKLAVDTHPSVDAAKANFIAEDESIAPLYFPDNPMIGVMRENGMKSLTLSQEFSFPTKYYHRANAQSQRALAAQEELKSKRLEIRQKIISAFYSLLAQERGLDFLKAQRDLLREIARIAESRRITGSVTAQDEMKAHLEQSKIESEILVAEQGIEQSRAEIAELLGTNDTIQLGKLDKPKLTSTNDSLNQLSWQGSPTIKASDFKAEEAVVQKTLAAESFIPDFKFSMQSSIEKGNKDQTFAIELKFPLWFFERESSDYVVARSRLISASKTLESTKREWQSQRRKLASRIIAKNNVLRLYETTLIPQALSTITSSRSAYRAGRVGFMEILDSERTVYSMQIVYYQELRDFCEAIAELERITGQSISTLPFGDNI